MEIWFPWVRQEAAQRALFEGAVFESRSAQEAVARSDGARSDGATWPPELAVCWYAASYVRSLDACVPLENLCFRLTRRHMHRPLPVIFVWEDSHDAAAGTAIRAAVGFNDFAFLVSTEARRWLVARSVAVAHSARPERSGPYYRNTPALAVLCAGSAHPRCRQVALNGVDGRFLERVARGPGFYFLGRLLRGRGLLQLHRLMAALSPRRLDVFGTGPDEEELKVECPNFNWRGLASHAELLNGGFYRCFVNPSLSEVRCSATAEALAAGCFALLPRHERNDVFAWHPNALFFFDGDSFREAWHRAVTTEPQILAEREREAFVDWDLATGRFVEASIGALR